jgi:hypothetical protein
LKKSDAEAPAVIVTQKTHLFLSMQSNVTIGAAASKKLRTFPSGWRLLSFFRQRIRRQRARRNDDDALRNVRDFLHGDSTPGMISDFFP